MDYVIDIQGFHDKDDCFVAKEVAVIALDEELIAHWIVLPTYVFTELPKLVRKKNNWVTQHHHGLEWFEGDVSLRQLHANLRDIARNAGKIYTRGSEKASYLQSITTREVQNLEDTDCPSFNDLPRSRQLCLRHGLLKRPTLYCALSNAAKLKDWILRDVSPTDARNPSPAPAVKDEPTTSTDRVCYSPVVASNEYNPDWASFARSATDRIERCPCCRRDPESVDETDCSDCEH